MKFDTLATRFVESKKQLNNLFLMNADPSDEQLSIIDRELSSAFNDLLNARLSTYHDHADRISFLLNLLQQESEVSELSSKVIDCISADLASYTRLLLKSELKLVDEPIDTRLLSQPLVELCYSSKACFDFNPREIEELKEHCIEKNKQNGITGVLLFDDKTSSFFQVLEGKEINLRRLMDKIVADQRHSDINIRFQGPINERLYSNWAMCIVTTTQIKQCIDHADKFESWFETYLELPSGYPKSLSHKWMVDSISQVL